MIVLHLYSNDLEHKDRVRNEAIKTLNYAKTGNKVLYAMLKNVDTIWSDLRNEDLLASKEKSSNSERLEPAIVGNIMNFVGVDGFKRDKV